MPTAEKFELLNQWFLRNLIPNKSMPIYGNSFTDPNSEIFNKPYKKDIVMKVLTGHLTAGNKKAITEILRLKLNCGRIGNTTYLLKEFDTIRGVYTVTIIKKDRGLIPCPGSELRESKYTSTFTI